MSSGHTVTITPSDAHVEVRLDGFTIGIATVDRPSASEVIGKP